MQNHKPFPIFSFIHALNHWLFPETLILNPPYPPCPVPHWPAPIVWELLLCEVAQLVSTSSNEERSLPVEWDLTSPYQWLHVVPCYLTSILSEHSVDPWYWLLLGHLGCGAAHRVIESETRQVNHKSKALHFIN